MRTSPPPAEQGRGINLIRLPRAVSARLRRRGDSAAAGPLHGLLDEPAGLWLGRAPVTFRGWALDGTSRSSEVDVVINGTAHAAHLGEPRPDVATNLGRPGVAADCGWSVLVDLSAWPQGELDVKVFAGATAGAATTIDSRSYMLHGAVATGRIDIPLEESTVDQLLVVAGWAVIGAHLPVRVDVEVDGRPVGRARLRVPRPDVEAADPERNGPLAGFEYRGLIPGTDDSVAEVGVVAVDRSGDESRLPIRRVRVEPAAAVIDARRAAVLRQRTQDDAATLLRVPRTPRRLTSGRDVMVFTHSLQLGGGQLYLQELVRQLAPSLNRCIVVSPADGVLRNDLEAMGVQVVVSGMGLPPDMETYEGQVRQLAMLERSTGCEVAIMNTLGTWPAVDAAERLGIPTIWAIHESFEFADWLNLNFGDAGCDPYVRSRIEHSLKVASRLVFEARATSEMFAPHAAPDRRVVIPYGVDIDAIDAYAADVDRDEAREQRGLAAGATVLLSMGIVEERKSQACLVEAFAEIADVHRDAVLVMVGDHRSPYSAALHELIAGLRLRDRVRLLPITSEIYPWYAVADVLVSAADVESVPRSMLEAMAFGVPVLAADVFGVPELIDDGLNGWLFRARDMVALTAGLHRVLSLGGAARSRAGGAARSRVESEHRSSNYGKAYAALIDTVAPRQ
jgi:D-inositol-3-phosphate glycosyltransferase